MVPPELTAWLSRQGDRTQRAALATARRLVLILLAGALAVAGLGFLLAAGFMALADWVGTAWAALILGGGAVVVAGALMALSVPPRRRRPPETLPPPPPPPPPEEVVIAAVVEGLSHTVRRHPVGTAAAAVGAGVLAGLYALRRGRSGKGG